MKGVRVKVSANSAQLFVSEHLWCWMLDYGCYIIQEL